MAKSIPVDEPTERNKTQIYNGKAVAMVRKGGLYFPVTLHISQGMVYDMEVGSGDAYVIAESKAMKNLKNWNTGS